MKRMTKAIVAIAAILFAMLVVPLLIVHLSPADLGMSLTLLMFFVANPVLMIALGMLAGSDLRRLWWIPLAAALVFPVFFGIAVGDFYIWDLYIYSAIYAVAGGVAMLLTHLTRTYRKRRKSE